MHYMVSKREEILRELRKHGERGVTIIQVASKLKVSSGTAGKWLHRLTYDGLAESLHYGSTLVFYPSKTKTEVKTRKNEK